MKKENKIFTIAIVLLIIILSLITISYISSKQEGQLVKIHYNDLLELTENKEDFILIVSQRDDGSRR